MSDSTETLPKMTNEELYEAIDQAYAMVQNAPRRTRHYLDTHLIGLLGTQQQRASVEFQSGATEIKP